jgi:aryl carrier-like protein
MYVYHNKTSNNPTHEGSGQDEALKQFLQKASTDPTILSTASAETFLAQEIGRALFGFMLKDPSEIDYTVAPIRMGVDSLLAIELRNWFRQRLGVDITVIDIMGSASLTQLGRTAAKSMALKKAAP